MGSFAGIQFIVSEDGYKETRTGRVAIQEIPGGDNFYVDQGGRGPMYIDMTVLLTNVSQLGSLMANLGQISVLDVDGRDSHMCVLMEVGGGPQFGSEQLTADLKLLAIDT